MKKTFMLFVCLLMIITVQNLLAENSITFLGADCIQKDRSCAVFEVNYSYNCEESGAKITAWYCAKNGSTTVEIGSKYVENGKGIVTFQLKVCRYPSGCQDIRAHFRIGKVSIWTDPVKICHPDKTRYN